MITLKIYRLTYLINMYTYYVIYIKIISFVLSQNVKVRSPNNIDQHFSIEAYRVLWTKTKHKTISACGMSNFNHGSELKYGGFLFRAPWKCWCIKILTLKHSSNEHWINKALSFRRLLPPPFCGSAHVTHRIHCFFFNNWLRGPIWSLNKQNRDENLVCMYTVIKSK